VSCGEGGVITTDDDELAERIRNMRSNYGIRSERDVPLTINARMAESQAAIALMSLDDLETNVAANRKLRDAYREGLAGIRGLTMLEPACVTSSNEQHLVCEVDEGEFGMPRDALLSVLRAEGVIARRDFAPGVHRTAPYAVTHPQGRETLAATDAICGRVLQLPLGAAIDAGDVERIACLIRDAQVFAAQLDDAMAGAGAVAPAS
jgi:dTDP-4-amino-4,6-dideoxygalactose transaminase